MSPKASTSSSTKSSPHVRAPAPTSPEHGLVPKAASRPASASSSASATSHAYLGSSVAPILVGVERIKVDGVVVVDGTPNIGVSHDLEYVGECGHNLVQVARHLHTSVSRLGRAVGVNLSKARDHIKELSIVG